MLLSDPYQLVAMQPVSVRRGGLRLVLRAGGPAACYALQKRKRKGLTPFGNSPVLNYKWTACAVGVN